MLGSKGDNNLWNAALFHRDEKKVLFGRTRSQVVEK